MMYELYSVHLILRHVRVMFSDKIEPGRFPFLDYVSYDETFCADFLQLVHLNNLTHMEFNSLGLKNIHLYYNVKSFVNFSMRHLLISMY
jgi:hypothetical protein